MKNKFTKVLMFTMALASILCMAIAITASANEAEIKPEIISKNMEYSDKYSIMYAVAAESVAEGPVTINVYREYPTGESTPVGEYVATEPQDEQIGGETRSVYVFTGFGIGAQDFADKIYAQATDKAGNKSDVVEYSVVEYFLERLYGGYEIDSIQKNLYEAGLAFGAAAQDRYAPSDAYRVNEYKYVRVVGGTANGVAKGMFLEGTELTLSENADGWQVTTASDGVTEKIEGTTYVLKDNALIEACVREPDLAYSYFEKQKAAGEKVFDYNFDSLSYEALYKGGSNDNQFLMKSSNMSSGFNNGSGWVAAGTHNSDDTTDKAIRIGKNNASGSNTQNIKLGFYNVNVSDMNCVVFETEFKLSIADIALSSTTNRMISNFGFSTAYSTTYNVTNMVDTAAISGPFDATLQNFTSMIYSGTDQTFENDTWYRLTMEYYKEEGIIRYYVDGYLVKTVEAAKNLEITNVEFVLNGGLLGSCIYFDNTYFGTVDKTLAE